MNLFFIRAGVAVAGLGLVAVPIFTGRLSGQSSPLTISPSLTFEVAPDPFLAVDFAADQNGLYFLVNAKSPDGKTPMTQVVGTDLKGNIKTRTALQSLRHVNPQISADGSGRIGVSRLVMETGSTHLTMLSNTGSLQEDLQFPNQNGKLALHLGRPLIGNKPAGVSATHRIPGVATTEDRDFEQPYERIPLPSGKVMFVEFSAGRVTFLLPNGKWSTPMKLTPPLEDASPRAEVANGGAEAFLAASNSAGQVYVAVGVLDFQKGIAVLQLDENARIIKRYRLLLPAFASLKEGPGKFNEHGYLLPLSMRAVDRQLFILSTYGNRVAVYALPE